MASTAQSGLRILSLQEELIPDSSKAMTWRCEDHGMGMTLAKEVPVLIARSLPDYLTRLSAPIQEALFAIHPGGPKVLDQVAKLLQLQPHQTSHSTQVLRQFGNMSSATLPHIWEKMINDPGVASGTPIISLAFGPGLIISGGLFQKL
jgi:predicted naringenin-chalcone synthase